MNLDATDRAILLELQDQARMTNADLAAAVGLSPSAALRRVRALEESGVIDKYVTVVNPKKVGRSTTVFIEVSLSAQADDHLDHFEAAIVKCPEVMSCHLMAGKADYLVQVACGDVADYERVHRDWISKLPGVSSIRSNFAIREVHHRTGFDLQTAD